MIIVMFMLILISMLATCIFYEVMEEQKIYTFYFAVILAAVTSMLLWEIVIGQIEHRFEDVNILPSYPCTITSPLTLP